MRRVFLAALRLFAATRTMDARRGRRLRRGFLLRCAFLPRRGQWMRAVSGGCATSCICTPRFSVAPRFFAVLRFSAVSRAADAALHVKIMFSTSLYCPCADRFANAPFPKSKRPLAIRRPPAAKMRPLRSGNAIAPIGRQPPCRGTPRAENAGCGKRRSRSACGKFNGRLCGACADARRAAGGCSRLHGRRIQPRGTAASTR